MEQPALSVPSTTIDYSAEPRRMIVDHWPVGSFSTNASNERLVADLLREEVAYHMALKSVVQPVIAFYDSLHYSVRYNPKATAYVPMGLLQDLYDGYLAATDRQLGAGSDRFRPGHVRVPTVAEILAGLPS